MGSTVKPGFAAQAAKAALQQPPARPAVATGVRELELGSGASVSSSSVLSVLLGVPRTATAPALPGLAAAPVLACAAAFALAPFALAAGDVLSRSPVLEPGLGRPVGEAALDDGADLAGPDAPGFALLFGLVEALALGAGLGSLAGLAFGRALSVGGEGSLRTSDLDLVVFSRLAEVEDEPRPRAAPRPRPGAGAPRPRPGTGLAPGLALTGRLVAEALLASSIATDAASCSCSSENRPRSSAASIAARAANSGA